MFSLKWNDYQECLGTRVSGLFESDDLTDVSLACEDGVVIKSHKFILSLFSTFFRNIFSENPCKHPIVILKGLRSPEVRRVLSFIYLGQAKMKEWEITEFLQAAESLRIDGINSNNPIINSTDSSSRVLTSTSTTGTGGPVLRTGDAGSRVLSAEVPPGDRDRDSGSATSIPSIGSPHSWPPTSRRSSDCHYHQPDVQVTLREPSPRSHQSQTQRGESHLSDSEASAVSRQTLSVDGIGRTGSPITIKRSRSSELIITETAIRREKEDERIRSPFRFRPGSRVDVNVPLIIQSEDRDHDGSGGIGVAQFYRSDVDEAEDGEGDEVQDLSTYHSSDVPVSPMLPPRKRSWEVDRSLQPYQSPAGSSSWPDSSTSIVRGSSSTPVKSTNYLPLSLLAAASGSVSASAAAAAVSQSSYSALRTLPLFSPTNCSGRIGGPPSTGAGSSGIGYPSHYHRTPLPISPISSSSFSNEDTQRRHAAALAAATGSYHHHHLHRQGQQGPSHTITSHQLSRIRSNRTSPPPSSSRPRTKAIRSSQVPQSSRYTAAEVDSMVEQVDNFPGPLVPCAICAKFVKRERLRAHIHECHLLQGEKITCPHCFIGLKSKGSYRVHIWRHKRGNLGIKGGPPGTGNSQPNPTANIPSQAQAHQHPHHQFPHPLPTESELRIHLQQPNK